MLSLRRRLVLEHLAAVLVIAAAAASVGWWGLSRAVHGQLDAALLALAQTEAGMLVDSKGPVQVHEAPPGTAPPSLMRLDRLIQIVDSDGNVLARSANLGAGRLPASGHLLKRLAAGQPVFQTLPHASEEPLRMVSVPAVVAGRGMAVQVAGSLDDANHLLQSAIILFAAMAVALLTAVGFVGVRLTRKIFGAVDGIALHARRIGETNLHERLAHPGTDDEIGHLVATLNDMLERLERTFDVQRRFTADASHELRSPLSRLRAEIEVTLRRPRDALEYVATLRSCLEDVERMTLLVEELLMLARYDAGQERMQPEATELAALASDTLQRLEPLARARKINLVLEAEAPVTAAVNRGPAGLVLTNLLENAIKFSPVGGEVLVRVASAPAGAMLSVADQGPGIDSGELPFLFDRFYRGSRARAGAVEGVGLGLALSQAIARAYGGSIEATNHANRGALLTVVFPCADAKAGAA